MDKQMIEDIDRFLDEMDLDYIPEEYVTSALITYISGDQKVVTTGELERIMDSDLTFRELGIDKVRLMLDLPLIRETVFQVSEKILSSLED